MPAERVYVDHGLSGREVVETARETLVIAWKPPATKRSSSYATDR